jgi:flagellar biosynthesis protein FlhG
MYSLIDEEQNTMSRSIAITGGKGGVGKSNIAVNLALAIGRQRRRVALLDADFALANADVLCGVTPSFNLGHVIAGVKELREIGIRLTDMVTLIPGGSGLEQLANFSLISKPQVREQVRQLESELDVMLIDTAAGIGENVSTVLAAAGEIVVVVTPDPTSIVDGYATIKVVLRRQPTKPISVIVNDVVSVGDGERVFRSISTAMNGFLGRTPRFLGIVPHDPEVQDAIRRQVPVIEHAPNAPASRAIKLIAKTLTDDSCTAARPTPQSFWEQLSGN